MLKFLLATLFIAFVTTEPLFFHPSQKKEDSVICPDYRSACDRLGTCCLNRTKQFSCCPLPNGVCCEDGLHCCPENFACDGPEQKCIKADTGHKLNYLSLSIAQHVPRQAGKASTQPPSKADIHTSAPVQRPVITVVPNLKGSREHPIKHPTQNKQGADGIKGVPKKDDQHGKITRKEGDKPVKVEIVQANIRQSPQKSTTLPHQTRAKVTVMNAKERDSREHGKSNDNKHISKQMKEAKQKTHRQLDDGLQTVKAFAGEQGSYRFAIKMTRGKHTPDAAMKVFKATAVPKMKTVKVAVVPKIKTVKEPVTSKVKTVETPVLPKVKTVKAPVVPKAKTVRTPDLPKIKTVKAPVIPKIKTVQAPVVPKIKTVKAPVVSKIKTVQVAVVPKIKTVKAPVVPKIKTVKVAVVPIIKTVKEPVVPKKKTVKEPVVLKIKTVKELVTSKVKMVKAPVVPIIKTVKEPVTPKVKMVKTPVLSKVKTVKAPVVPKAKTVTTPDLRNVKIVKTPDVPKIKTVKEPVLPKIKTVKSAVIPKIKTVTPPVVPKLKSVKTPVVTKVDTVKAQVIPKVKTVKTPVVPKVKSVKAPVVPKVKAVKPPVVPKVTSVKVPVVPKVKTVKPPVVPKVKTVTTPVLPKVKTVQSADVPKVKTVRSPVEPEVKVRTPSVPLLKLSNSEKISVKVRSTLSTTTLKSQTQKIPTSVPLQSKTGKKATTATHKENQKLNTKSVPENTRNPSRSVVKSNHLKEPNAALFSKRPSNQQEVVKSSRLTISKGPHGTKSIKISHMAKVTMSQQVLHKVPVLSKSKVAILIKPSLSPGAQSQSKKNMLEQIRVLTDKIKVALKNSLIETKGNEFLHPTNKAKSMKLDKGQKTLKTSQRKTAYDASKVKTVDLPKVSVPLVQHVRKGTQADEREVKIALTSPHVAESHSGKSKDAKDRMLVTPTHIKQTEKPPVADKLLIEKVKKNMISKESLKSEGKVTSA